MFCQTCECLKREELIYKLLINKQITLPIKLNIYAKMRVDEKKPKRNNQFIYVNCLFEPEIHTMSLVYF